MKPVVSNKQRVWGVLLILGGVLLGVMAVDSLSSSRNVGSGAIRGLVFAPLLIFIGIRKFKPPSNPEK